MTANRHECALAVRPCQPRNRRERLHCLVHHSKLDAHRLADAIGRRYDRLIAYAAVNGADEMPIRDLIALTRVTGRTFALEAEVADCGFLLVRNPEAHTASDVLTELADVAIGTGRVFEAHREHARAKDPDAMRAIVAAARALQTEIAEFIQAAETSATPFRVAK